MKWGQKGECLQLLPSDGLTDEATAAVREVSEELTATGFKCRVRTHDKLGALALLAKYLGMDGEGLNTLESLEQRIARLTANRDATATPPGANNAG